MRIGTIIMAAAGLAFATSANATSAPAQQVQPDKNASGKVLVLVPLTLTKIDDLDFGTLIPSGVSGFVAIDSTTGARTTGGGVTGVSSAAGHRAYFGGAGTPNQQVIVTVSQPTQLTDAASDTITVLALTLQGSPIKSIDATTRTFFFGVGGILLINANQPEGLYSASFDVTANYQ